MAVHGKDVEEQEDEEDGSKGGRGRDDGGAKPSEGLLLPAFMSQDIYVLPREGVNARRAAATIHRRVSKERRVCAP